MYIEFWNSCVYRYPLQRTDKWAIHGAVLPYRESSELQWSTSFQRVEYSRCRIRRIISALLCCSFLVFLDPMEWFLWNFYHLLCDCGGIYFIFYYLSDLHPPKRLHALHVSKFSSMGQCDYSLCVKKLLWYSFFILLILCVCYYRMHLSDSWNTTKDYSE